MDSAWSALRSRAALVRFGLAGFVVLWLAGPEALRVVVPIWVPFLIAVGLEVQFFAGAVRRDAAGTARDRGPQAIDRDELGYSAEGDELILVRRDGEEVWLPYPGDAPDEEPQPLSAAPFVAQRRPFNALRRLVIGFAVIGALATVTWYVENHRGWSGLGDAARARATARFSTEASRIARKPVEIRCDDAGDRVGIVQHADGVAEVGGRIAYLTPERCYELYRLAFKGDGDVSSNGAARALAVLAHESWHLAGVRDEATTECYALQSGVELGRRLGLDSDTAERMMRQQLVENARRAGAALEYRVPPECRDGGRLDLNPRRSPFP